jgi:IS5 family transposase
LRGFAGIDLSVAAVPDATTVLNFRHWLEQHDLTRVLFDEVGAMLEERGLSMRQGTIVDATIIAAPSSTKNKQKARDPEMHQTKKGNQWHFGMKAHIGVDVASGVVHTVTGTAASHAHLENIAAMQKSGRTKTDAKLAIASLPRHPPKPPSVSSSAPRSS